VLLDRRSGEWRATLAPVKATLTTARRSSLGDPLLTEARSLISRYALRDGTYVVVGDDGGSLLELILDPMGLVEVARSDLPAAIAALDRTGLLVTVALLRAALASDEQAARCSFGALARAIGWPPPNGREVGRLRTALLEVTLPRVSRHVVRVRPDGSGLVPPPRATVTGLFRYPPRISVARPREPAPSSLIALEPAYLPLLVTGALVDRDPTELARLPSDAARRLALLAGLRPSDSNASRGRSVLRTALAALAPDGSPYAGSRLEGEWLILERRRPL
jgi:hypothetical protein